MFEGARADVVEPLVDEPDFPQYLLRALIYRAITDHLERADQRRPAAHGPYQAAVQLAVQLADHA